MVPITIEEFDKVEMKVGEVVEAKKVEGSEKLIRMVVDFGGEDKRVVFSGIFKWYQPEQLAGKKTVFATNVIPKKIMGEESAAMILGVQDDESGELSILLIEKEVKNGSRVY